jgi:hypothetical protein
MDRIQNEETSVADPDPVPFSFFTTGSGMGKIKIRILDEHSGSYFREIITIFCNFWIKILKFFDADPDPGSGIFLTLDPKNTGAN